MRYVGGKFRQRREFVPAILKHTPNRDRYLEPFVGGGSMLEKMAPHFRAVRASDAHEDLILMYQALQEGWVPPQSVTREEYNALRRAEPSALRGFVGFGVSFGGKWFGGYATEKNVTPETFPQRTYRNLQNVMKDLPDDTEFSVRSFEQWKPHPGTVVYNDPPYELRGVEYKTSTEFPHTSFWRLMDEWWQSGVHVYVSEFNAPTHWVPIAESVQRLTITGNSPVTKREQGLQHDYLWVPRAYEGGY
jgi:DNA adenine methylase